MNTITLLRKLYIAVLITSAILAISFETGLLVVDWAPEASLAYVLEIVGVVLAVIAIPLALKLLHFQRIKAIIQGNETKYRSWSIYRITMLAAPLYYNLLMYYLLGCDVTCGYLALMVVVAMLFIWPSRSRMEYECELPYSQSEA